MPEPRSDFRLIGDPHITRKFEMNVPLARRGEREELLFKQFEESLWARDGERIIIVVGDTFEKPICSLADLYRTMTALRMAAASQPHITIIVMAGNHDISPQANNPGAFDVLSLIEQNNLIIAREPLVFERIALFPWEWDRTALEQLEDLRGEQFDTAVGHWDLVAYDEKHTEHLCPAKELAAMGAQRLYSGHWHVAGDYIVDGLTVHCTGSMQPMTHAEDPDGKLYVTMTLEEYEEADPETLKNKYVRVIAEQGIEVDPLADCLGFKVQRSDTTSEPEDYNVDVEEFKVADVIQRNLNKHDVPEDVGAFIKERINADS